MTPQPGTNLSSFGEVKKFVRGWLQYRRKARTVHAARMPCIFGFTCEKGDWISGHAGDWLAEEEDGRLVVVPNVRFLRDYARFRGKVTKKRGKG